VLLPGDVWTHDRRIPPGAHDAAPESKTTPALGRTGVVVGGVEGYSAVTVPFMSGWSAQMNG
jgi:hypothetical protein